MTYCSDCGVDRKVLSTDETWMPANYYQDLDCGHTVGFYRLGDDGDIYDPMGVMVPITVDYHDGTRGLLGYRQSGESSLEWVRKQKAEIDAQFEAFSAEFEAFRVAVTKKFER